MISKNLCVVLSPLALLPLALCGCGSKSSGIASNVAITSPVNTPSPAPSPAATDSLTVSSPSIGVSVASPFTLSANATTCSSQPVTAMTYSLDTNAMVTLNGASINTQVVAESGAHTLKVLAIGNGGAQCSSNVSFNVLAPAQAQNTVVPSNAITSAGLQVMTNWLQDNDSDTSGGSSGYMNLVGSPSMSGTARRFSTSFSDSGGERYWVGFGSDTNAQNFFYDVQVYIEGSASNIGNLEFDMNQVLSNGQTVIYGFQCDGYSGTWDYTENSGTPVDYVDRWIHSNATCNPRDWSTNTWHHLQISYSRDEVGNVTYGSVWLDGTESKINATVPTAFALGWESTLLTNFQVDGLGSGSNTVYLDNLSVSRW